MERTDAALLNFVLEVIELYKRLPALWNVKCTEYKDKYEKEKQYNILLTKYRERYPTADKRELTAKINLWRTNWRREHKRLLELNQNVVREEDFSKSTAWYYEPLSFLQVIDNIYTLPAIIKDCNEESYIKVEPDIFISETRDWNSSNTETVVDPNPLSLLQPMFETKDPLTSKRIEIKKKGKINTVVEKNLTQLKQSRSKMKNKIQERPIIIIDSPVKANSSELKTKFNENREQMCKTIKDKNEKNSQKANKLKSMQLKKENENLKISPISIPQKRRRENQDFEPNVASSSRLIQSHPEQQEELLSFNPVTEVNDVNLSKRMQPQSHECNKIADVWATKLQKMSPQQQIFAEKFVNEILFEGQMGTLHRNSMSLM